MSRKRFQYGQSVYVHYKGAGYKGEYKGVDTFEQNKKHTVEIPSMHRELSFADNDIFGSLEELEEAHPQVSSNL